MKIRIAPTRRRKLKHSIELVNEILLSGNCKIIKRVKIKGKGTKIEAEKPLKNGRLHIKVSNPHGHYIMDIHFDPVKHFDILHPSPKTKRKLGMYSKSDCKEVRDFVNEHVFPLLQKYRPTDSISQWKFLS